MQQVIDIITSNLAFFVGLAAFIIATTGLVLALRTDAGRDALGTAAVRLAVAVLAFAERWLGGEVRNKRLAALEGDPQALHPVVTAQTDLQSWLARR
jgi:hypothetical protein